MFKQLVIFLVLLWSFPFVAQATDFKIDLAHSSMRFEIGHMGISTVEGRFKEFEGDLSLNEKEPQKSTAKVTVQVKTIDTGISARDTHLLSADFFNAEKFPTMTFVSTKVEGTPEKKDFKVLGNFTMHGVTKEIQLNVKFLGKIVQPDKTTRAAFEVVGNLNREDFGLTWNKIVEGISVVGKEVKMVIRVEAIEPIVKK